MSTAAARIGSLCSGYGGLDMAVEAVFGGRTVWHCEIEDAPSKILAAHWDVPNHRDLKSVDWSTVEPVDIMTAGYPCQPFSHAGRRGGSDDPRHLWPFVAEAVRRVRPGFVVLENVAGHRTLGLDAVLGDLAAMGYVGSVGSLRAADVGAPHGRERVFILARDSDRLAGTATGAFGGRPGTVDEPGTVERTVRSDCSPADADPLGRRWNGRAHEPFRGSEGRTAAARTGKDAAAHAGGPRLAQHPGEPSTQETRADGGDVATGDRGSRAATDWGPYRPAIERWERATGRLAPAPTELAPRGGQRLSPRFVEWMMGLPAGWVTDVPISRNEQLKALGNGVVPQQAAEALRRLLPIASEAAA